MLVSVIPSPECLPNIVPSTGFWTCSPFAIVRDQASIRLRSRRQRLLRLDNEVCNLYFSSIYPTPGIARRGSSLGPEWREQWPGLVAVQDTERTVRLGREASCILGMI